MAFNRCANWSDCVPPAEGVAVLNLSAELPDQARFFGFFQCDPTSSVNPPYTTCESIVSQRQADWCAALCVPDSIFLNEAQTCESACGSYTVQKNLFIGSTQAEANSLAHDYACAAIITGCQFGNALQSCTVNCVGTSSYSVAAGAILAGTQADADRLASALACNIAALGCSGALVPNTAQSCSVVCPSGGTWTRTVPAGTVHGLTVEQANATAQELACVLAVLACDTLPPLIGNTAQTCTQLCDGVEISLTIPAGAFVGVDQFAADNAAFLFCALALSSACAQDRTPDRVNVGNRTQICPISCGTGSTFTYVVPPGSFRADNQITADAAANSYACAHAYAVRFCLDDLPIAGGCTNELIAAAVTTTGPGIAQAMAVISGTLPTGLILSGSVLYGIPTTPGSFTFTVRALDNEGNYAQREYTLAIAEITTDILPDGALSTAYAQAISVSGFTNPTFSISGGTLPAGLTLAPATGVISGTPTMAGDFSFVVSVTDGTNTCERGLAISVVSTLSPTAWYSMETTGATIADVSGNAADMALAVGAAATAAAGKVDLAATKATNSCRYNTGALAVLAWTSGDVNIFGWVLVSSPGTSVLTTQRIGITLDSVGFTGIGELTLRGNNTWRFNNNNGLVLSGALAMGAFIFYRIHYDSAAQKWGVAFSNAAPTYEAGTDVVTPGATGQFDLLLNGSFLDVGNVQQADEVCIFYGAMTQADIDSIYNGGAGRTYP